LYDLETPARGSRNWVGIKTFFFENPKILLKSWYKNSSIWNHFAAYFPIKLVKTTDLPADRNYIMGFVCFSTHFYLHTLEAEKIS